MSPARELSALFVHGVGEQGSNFAADAIKLLRGALAKRGVKLVAGVVHYAPLADEYERTFLQAAQKQGSRGNAAQRLVVGTLADALAYQSNARLRERIMYLVDWEYSRLRAGSVHIFAHSLGGLVMTDWLRSRKNVRPLKLWTMGSNLGLFNLGQPFDCPPALLNDGVWTNLWDDRDMLGFPLRAQAAFSQVQDVEVRVGSWLTGWTGLAHTKYWGDRKLWKKTIPDLLGGKK
jgi:hypothetical protein